MAGLRPKRSITALFCIAVACLGSPHASAARGDGPAQGASDEGTVIAFEAEFFAVYRPATALDMVERVPGFTIDEGDTVRGFGGAAGNVLIDGERPSAKTQSVRIILGQIPADAVSRIELIRGRTPGIDMRGQTVVVNVIRGKSGTGGFVEAVLRLSEALRFSPSGEVVLTGDAGGYGYRAGLRYFMLEDLDNQPETLFDAAGQAVEFHDEDADIIPHETTLTANVEKTFGAWDMRLNNEFFYSDFVFRESSPAFDAMSGDFLRHNGTQVNDEVLRGEAGMDAKRSWSQSLSLKLIGLQTLKRLNSRQQLIETRESGEVESVRQTIGNLSGESILRGVLTVTPDSNRTYEAGLEGAYNFLDSSVDLSVDDGSGPMPVDLPVSNARVEEYRGELFANMSWKPRQDWTLELGLTAELSRLVQTGDAEESRTFLFFKPAFGAVHALSAQHQLQFEFLREVAQLDFQDFVSSVTLNEQTTDLGNPELEPQRAWIARATWDGRFTGRDSLSLTAEHKWLQAVQDLVPIAGRFDAPGNIGEGRLWRTRIQWQVSLERIGLDNALLEGWYEFSASTVRDPVNGESRRLSFRSPGEPFQSHRLDASFRQDFPDGRWAWGGSYAYRSDIHEFRLEETRRIELGNFDIDVFAETTRIPGIKLRLTVERAEPRVLRRRVLYDGPRSDGIIRAVEVRDRTPETRVVFSARRTF